MTPAIQIMKAAYDAEYDRWDCWLPSRRAAFQIRRLDDDGVRKVVVEVLEGEDETEAKLLRLSTDAAMRAALLALAEMEPTEEMQQRSILTLCACSPEDVHIQAPRAYIRAALHKGEA